MRKITKGSQILRHLKHSNTISQTDLIHYFDYHRLCAVIQYLLVAGHSIAPYNEPSINSNRNHFRYDLKEASK